MSFKRVLITGAKGQLGYELQRSYPLGTELIASDRVSLDITDPIQIQTALERYQPDLVINAAAYTAVDKAESDQDHAQRLNGDAAGFLAQGIAAQNAAIQLIHISTDFVFDGTQSLPYAPDAATHPLGVYGATKLSGEQQVQQYLPNALILRTSWLYSAHGHNFVKTMLRFMQEREQLGIVYDQVGTPTWARTLAHTIWALAAKNASGILHCSDNGVASWYDFARAIQEEGYRLGLLTRRIPIHPIRSSAYPTPAQRPAFSVMDKSLTEDYLGYRLPYWRDSLQTMLAELNQTTHNS
ncbi:MAG: dTDP-4-dehydrorhamnose reductase [Thiothrix sp.]|nr:MAG: dTDP-4-dehydrorhamnose reductase [Thiothrix sp.]